MTPYITGFTLMSSSTENCRPKSSASVRASWSNRPYCLLMQLTLQDSSLVFTSELGVYTTAMQSSQAPLLEGRSGNQHPGWRIYKGRREVRSGAHGNQPRWSLYCHLLRATGAAAAAIVEWAEELEHLLVPEFARQTGSNQRAPQHRCTDSHNSCSLQQPDSTCCPVPEHSLPS